MATKAKTKTPAEGTVPEGGTNGTGETPAANGNGAVTAVEFETARNVVLIPIDQVRAHPLNKFRQHTDESRAELAQIVEADKDKPLNERRLMNYPLNVIEATDAEGKPVLTKEKKPVYYALHGNQRRDVYEGAGLTHVPAIVQNSDMTLADQLIELVNANRARPLTALESGLAYLELVEAAGGERGRGKGAKEKAGVTQADFAARIGKSAGYVSDAVKAAKIFNLLNKGTQDAIKKANGAEEVIGREHLAILGQLGDIEVRNRFAKAALDKKMSPVTLQAAVNIFTGRDEPSAAVSSVFGKFLNAPKKPGSTSTPDPADVEEGAGAPTEVTGAAGDPTPVEPPSVDAAIDQAISGASSTTTPPTQAKPNLSSEEARAAAEQFFRDNVIPNYTNLKNWAEGDGQSQLEGQDRDTLCAFMLDWFSTETERWERIRRGEVEVAAEGGEDESGEGGEGGDEE